MKKDKKAKTTGLSNDKPQTGKSVKQGLPIKTPVTDTVKNIVSQTPGLNQAKTTRDDLFPSDGDNLTV